MNQRFKAWLQALALSAACAGATAYFNLTLRESTHLQPSWLTYLHVGCAFFGVLALTWFIQGTPAALRETTNRAVVAQGVIARPIVGARASVGAGNLVVPAKSAFLSTPRCAMILCFVLCLMIQFVQVGKVVENTGVSRSGAGPQMQRLST
jgi:hypothetical protein